MAFRELTLVVQPGEPWPEPAHGDECYNHIELIKKKGRRKKSDPFEFISKFIPWNELNNSELIALCTYGFRVWGDDYYGVHPLSREEAERWKVLSKVLRRGELIRLVRKEIDPRDLPVNPAHIARNRLCVTMRNNWQYIHSQIQCSTCCWECTDAKALECLLENRGLVEGDR